MWSNSIYSNDTSNNDTLYSQIKSQIKTANANNEGGKLSISVASHNGSNTDGLIIEDGDASGELDVTIANE